MFYGRHRSAQPPRMTLVTTYIDHDFLADVDDTDKRPCCFLDWLVVYLMILDTSVVIFNSFILVPSTVLSEH